MHFLLTGKNALVCGSTQGIGRAVAELFARLGAAVTLVARNETALAAVQQGLPDEHGQKHHFIGADFSHPGQLKARVESYLQENPPIHILVNNTGGPPAGPAIDADIEEFRAAFAKHLICNQILARAVVPGMKAEKYGRIINIISTSVKQPIPGLGVSNTIRGAVANWAKTLSRELAAFGITVNNVLPGATKTRRLSSLIEEKAIELGKSFQEVEKTIIAEIPAGRFAEPEEIAGAVAFLASPAASYINGINITVDGGRTSCL